MPLNQLLVEGKLDAEVLNPLLAGNPLVRRIGSKGSLAPRARNFREDSKQPVGYLRDRDFDFLPPTDASQPTVDEMIGVEILGWRWTRHELENYLIDPAIIHRAMGFDLAEYQTRLVDAAQAIRHHQAGRWAIGQARRSFPPMYEFPTRPAGLNHPFQLPADSSEAGIASWIQAQSAYFLANAQASFDPSVLAAAFGVQVALLSEAFLAHIPNALAWCSGKDLLAALIPWLQASHSLHPTRLLQRVRDWIVLNPDETLALLPEWAALVAAVRA